MTVKKTVDALTIERTRGDASATLIYKLDGSPSRNVLASPSGREVDIMSTATWDGARLTILGKREMGGRDPRDETGLDGRGQYAHRREHRHARHPEADLQEVVLRLVTAR